MRAAETLSGCREARMRICAMTIAMSPSSSGVSGFHVSTRRFAHALSSSLLAALMSPPRRGASGSRRVRPPTARARANGSRAVRRRGGTRSTCAARSAPRGGVPDYAPHARRGASSRSVPIPRRSCPEPEAPSELDELTPHVAAGAGHGCIDRDATRFSAYLQARPKAQRSVLPAYRRSQVCTTRLTPRARGEIILTDSTPSSTSRTAIRRYGPYLQDDGMHAAEDLMMYLLTAPPPHGTPRRETASTASRSRGRSSPSYRTRGSGARATRRGARARAASVEGRRTSPDATGGNPPRLPPTRTSAPATADRSPNRSARRPRSGLRRSPHTA